MRIPIILWTLLGAAVVSADVRTASIYVQPVGTSATSPSLIAEIKYDVLDPSSSEVSSFEAPEIPDGAALVRIGIYDTKTKSWVSSTSVASVENFSKGFSPHFLLSVDAHGNYLGAACRGVRVDAGATRDFGPQARVVVSDSGKQPELNKPVVLSPEGKKVLPPEEKTFFQKYMASHSAEALVGTSANETQVLVASPHRGLDDHVWWRWRRPKIIDSYVLLRYRRYTTVTPFPPSPFVRLGRYRMFHGRW